jgi:hypothetical protein
MNRTVVIGGVVAVAVLLGVAAWLLIGGKSVKSTSEQLAAENAGPIALNPVAVVTDHAAAEAPDGRTLNITFPKFELTAKKGDTASAVFSTTWRMKLAPDERVLVAVASINGYMKSTGAAQPAAAAPAEPAVASTPATPPADGSTPAEGATPTAEAATPPAEPAATPAPAKPAAGDGVARVIVTFGTDASVTEWTDVNGTGGDRKVSKATTFIGGPADVRDGGTVPVTVTVELNGGTSADSVARINSLDLRLFAESAPLTPPAGETTTTPATGDAATTTTTPPATDGTTPPAETPPADGAAQPAPDAGTTPPPASTTP